MSTPAERIMAAMAAKRAAMTPEQREAEDARNREWFEHDKQIARELAESHAASLERWRTMWARADAYTQLHPEIMRDRADDDDD